MAEQPKYLQVADILRKEIAEGVFRDGQTLMTEEELRQRFNVSRQTIRQAIALLEDDGLVDRRRGSGTYVRHGPRRRQGIIHVGVVTTYITDYIFPSIVQGIESVFNENGVVMSLSATYGDNRTERNILERMLDGQVDGLIVEGARTAQENENEDLYRRLAERNIPVLFMNSYYPGMPNVPHVVMDDYGGGRIAAREVLSRGYRRPGGMFKVDDLQGKERLKGFLDEMRSEGVTIPDERLLLFGTEQRMNWQNTPEGKAFVDRLVRREADCMTCYNDVFASSLMSILQGRGMKLPEDMGFIGFDNAVYAEMTNPKLTTLGHPKEAFGALVAEKLLRMISGERERSVNMAWTLIERDSLPRVERL
jgi:GntR family transcriptional regulator of arabinose operon